MATLRLPQDDTNTRQDQQLEAAGVHNWLDDEQTNDTDCWGMDPALAAERREEALGHNHFGQDIH